MNCCRIQGAHHAVRLYAAIIYSACCMLFVGFLCECYRKQELLGSALPLAIFVFLFCPFFCENRGSGFAPEAVQRVLHLRLVGAGSRQRRGQARATPRGILLGTRRRGLTLSKKSCNFLKRCRLVETGGRMPQRRLRKQALPSP